ncbi:MAG: 1-hydroxycarotenoid 3,4-desaturase CrtD [Bacteroidota bacterium]
MPHAIVVGSGIAGIAAALRLRHKGYTVAVYEANPYPGGKIHNLEKEGYRFDTGPSLFTMPHLVDELFQLFGDDPTDFFRYERKKNICNYFWEDGTRFVAPATREDFVSAATETFAVSRAELTAFLDRNREKYDLTADIFLEKSLHKLGTYASLDTLKSLLQAYKLDIGQSLHKTNEAAFTDPKLVQLFDRYATYNGSSPYRTPGIMSMIPHLEMHYGTFLPQGGMRQITHSLYEYSLTKGVTYHLSRPVEHIEVADSRVIGIRAGGFAPADLVVSNADVFTSYQRLLPQAVRPRKILAQERSSSALIFYWGIAGSFPELDLHNIFFSDDYREEFRHIFEENGLYADPTVYVNITSKQESDDAPPGGENWFVMINTPGNFGQDWSALGTRARAQILAKLSRVLGREIEPLIRCEAVLDPVTIETKTSSHRGSLYGASSNSKFAAFLRHPNFTSSVRNLYFCGGSVHPGGGIPLCLLSAKIVSNLIKPAA